MQEKNYMIHEGKSGKIKHELNKMDLKKKFTWFFKHEQIWERQNIIV